MSNRNLTRLVGLMERLIEDGDPRSLREHAEELGLPLSSAHRLFNSLLSSGLLRRAQRGEYLPGPRLIALTQALDMRNVVGRLARPLLRDLSRKLSCTCHLGIFEAQMVTYLVKEGTDSRIFSKEGMQLEAYCSAIGKVLLASLPPDVLDAYLVEGEFVALTPYTKVKRRDIEFELEAVAAQGYALDCGEVSEGMNCLAVPVRGGRGRVCAAISATSYDWSLDPHTIEVVVQELQVCAADLGGFLGANL